MSALPLPKNYVERGVHLTPIIVCQEFPFDCQLSEVHFLIV